jgi:hypothetical protein
MDRIRAGTAGSVEHGVGVEVGADGQRTIAALGRWLVGRVDADHAHPEPMDGARDPLSDLAPVGDQDGADLTRPAIRWRAGNRFQSAAEDAHPAADAGPRQSAAGDPALDGADRDPELLGDLAGRQLVAHVAIVAANLMGCADTRELPVTGNPHGGQDFGAHSHA